MRFKKLIEHIVKESTPFEVDFSILAKLQTEINDKDYFVFISEITNGGFFFDKALHIYGSCNEPNFHSIIEINKLIKLEYKDLVKDMVVFGQDVFGNQFGFDKNGVVFFNIESAEREVIAKDFKDWIDIVLKDLDYFTGQSLLQRGAIDISFNERICPKKPFILGGEFAIENFYTEKYPLYISTNANVARQVFNLPEGTDIKIKPIE